MSRVTVSKISVKMVWRVCEFRADWRYAQFLQSKVDYSVTAQEEILDPMVVDFEGCAVPPKVEEWSAGLLCLEWNYPFSIEFTGKREANRFLCKLDKVVRHYSKVQVWESDFTIAETLEMMFRGEVNDEVGPCLPRDIDDRELVGEQEFHIEGVSEDVTAPPCTLGLLENPQQQTADQND